VSFSFFLNVGYLRLKRSVVFQLLTSRRRQGLFSRQARVRLLLPLELQQRRRLQHADAELPVTTTTSILDNSSFTRVLFSVSTSSLLICTAQWKVATVSPKEAQSLTAIPNRSHIQQKFRDLFTAMRVRHLTRVRLGTLRHNSPQPTICLRHSDLASRMAPRLSWSSCLRLLAEQIKTCWTISRSARSRSTS
jgi:hypothetical protein